MAFEVDEQEWPVLTVRAIGESTDRDLAQYISALQRALKRQEAHVLIVDARDGKNLKGTHRKIVADWNRMHEAELRKYRKGLVLVSNSTIVRGMITAIYWLFPPPFPYHTVAHLHEARLWAASRLNLMRQSA